MKLQRGFTLIELMIASMILIVVMLVGTYSYSLFSDKWDKQLGNVEQAVNRVKDLSLLNSLLDGVVPLALFNGQKGNGFYFHGEQQTLTAVSLNGLFVQDAPVVFSLSMQQINGKNVLLYQETSTTNSLLLKADDVVEFTHSKTLLPGLISAEFTYYGWPSWESKRTFNFTKDLAAFKLGWFDSYEGIITGLHPEKLSLALNFENGSLHLNSQYLLNSELLLSEPEGA
ncbi:PilW family protein [Paraglaciecola sp.]|uniref:PilW family protein n=1 Tax=Paraglaciecola sp. TaxID=1920173 RepID=UPI003EF4470C